MSKIPKIIHYCWFGGAELPKALAQCLESWKKIMPDYQIIKCDESKCTFDENEFVKRAYNEKKWAYVSDYYRLKMLYEYGGIYLDTDIRVKKSFNPLLNNSCFFNFLNDCVVGTAVIGAEPHNKLIGELISLYDNAVFSEPPNGSHAQLVNGQIILNKFDTNNFLFTLYFLDKYPQLKLNNRFQDLGDFVIYPKQLFEIGSIFNRHYAIHLGIGSWKNSNRNLERQELHGPLFEYLRVIKRNLVSRSQNKKLWFYSNK